MSYDLVLSYYKSFCTKISDLSQYFGDDSTFLFVQDFGKTSVAFGRHDIERHIEEQFWSTSVPLIAYNIHIENKTLTMSPMTSTQGTGVREVAVVVFGTLKAIHSNEDIRLTRLMGRKFVQTFVVYVNDHNNEHYFKNSVLSYVTAIPASDQPPSPSQPQQPSVPSPVYPSVSSLKSISADMIKAPTVQKLEFEKIVKNIDKLMNESNGVNEESSDKQICHQKNDLLPISANEIFVDSCVSVDRDGNGGASDFRFNDYQYLNDIWSKCQTNNKLQTIDKNHKNQNQWIAENHDTSDDNRRQTNGDTQNGSTTFADALRSGSQSFSVKPDAEPQDMRLIPMLSKSRLKPNNWLQIQSKAKNEFIGQQSITIIGSQNWYDICESNILFIANIPLGFSKTEFMALFDIYGKILSVKFVERTGVTFAFIYFDSKSSVETVLNTATSNNSLYINGLHLKVDKYKRRIPNV